MADETTARAEGGPTSLVSARIANAVKQLEAARTIDDWKVGVGDAVAEYVEYDRRKNLSTDAHIAAWELVQLSNRCLGRLLRDLPKAKRGPKSKASPDEGFIPGSENKPKVAEIRSLGLSRKRAYALERLSDMPADEFRAALDIGREKILQRVDPGTIAAVSVGIDNDAYGTPGEYAAAMHELFGGPPDLDPASNAMANNVIRARRFYTKDDSGLDTPERAVPWECNTLWMNSPFSAALVAEFQRKFIREYEAGRMKQGLTLMNADTSVTWFQELLERFPACLPARRIAFLHPKTAQAVKGNRFAQAIFYAGPQRERFREIFSRFGIVVVRYAGGAGA